MEGKKPDPFQMLKELQAANPNGLLAGSVARKINHHGENIAKMGATGSGNVIVDLAMEELNYHEGAVRDTTILKDSTHKGLAMEGYAGSGVVTDKGKARLDGRDIDQNKGRLATDDATTLWVPSTGRISPSESMDQGKPAPTSQTENLKSLLEVYNPPAADSMPPTTEISAECIRRALMQIQQPYPTNYENYRGIAVIINVIHFLDDASPRLGAEKDTENLAKILHQRNFQVKMLNNPTERVLKRVIQEIQSWKFENADSFLLAVMSHGDGMNICTADGIYVPILKGIVEPFNNQNGGAGLKGKPKIFLFNCCRGGEDDLGQTLAHDQMPQRFDHLTIPSWTDMIICYSSLDGYYSYRDMKEGSWFIQTFCEVLRKYGDSHDVITVLNIVSQVMKSVLGRTKEAVEGPDNKIEYQVKHKKQICPHYNIGFTRTFRL